MNYISTKLLRGEVQTGAVGQCLLGEVGPEAWFPAESGVLVKREVKDQKMEQGQCDRGAAQVESGEKLSQVAAPPFPSLSRRQRLSIDCQHLFSTDSLPKGAGKSVPSRRQNGCKATFLY